MPMASVQSECRVRVLFWVYGGEVVWVWGCAGWPWHEGKNVSSKCTVRLVLIFEGKLESRSRVAGE